LGNKRIKPLPNSLAGFEPMILLSDAMPLSRVAMPGKYFEIF
jgi:hypothetical protein